MPEKQNYFKWKCKLKKSSAILMRTVKANKNIHQVKKLILSQEKNDFTFEAPVNHAFPTFITLSWIKPCFKKDNGPSLVSVSRNCKSKTCILFSGSKRSEDFI